MQKKIIWVAAIVAVLAAVVWAILPKKLAAENRYVTASLERGDISQTVAANGTLNPVRLVNVGSQVSGIVKKLYADFNDHVRAGQILLELDPALIQAQLLQSEAGVTSAAASLDVASAKEARLRKLNEKGYVSRQDYDQAVQELKLAQAQLAVAQAQASRDRTNLAYTVIRSPVSGVIVSREVDLGQTVAASFQTPTLFKIAQDLSKMQIDSSYAEADVGSIRAGQLASFRVDAYPDRNFKGVVRQVRLNPTTQQNVVTYNVVIAVDNPDKILMPGMTAYVSVITAQKKDVLLIPNAALRFRLSEDKRQKAEGRNKGVGSGQSATAYVLETGQPKPIKIGVGISDNRMTEIVGGEIKEGVAVIVEDSQPPAKKSGTPGMRLF